MDASEVMRGALRGGRREGEIRALRRLRGMARSLARFLPRK